MEIGYRTDDPQVRASSLTSGYGGVYSDGAQGCLRAEEGRSRICDPGWMAELSAYPEVLRVTSTLMSIAVNLYTALVGCPVVAEYSTGSAKNAR